MALRNLSLRDFVIVDQLDLEFESGLTVLTGETGAGKSILLDALQLVLGARAETHVVREGANRAEISAEFSSAPRLTQWLEGSGFAENECLLLRRSIERSGKSRAWINGSPATAGQLREIGDRLVEIHGQHAWLQLTRPASVRALLDGYGNVHTDALERLWESWQAARHRADEALANRERATQERERLVWQIAELDRLAPQPHEWDDLNTSHKRLANAQSLIEAARAAGQVLAEDNDSAAALLTRGKAALQAFAELEPAFAAATDEIDSAIALTRDAAHALSAYARREGPNPEALKSLDERLSLWLTLARRFRVQPTDLPETLDGWRSQLASLEAQVDIDSLAQAAERAKRSFLEAATVVSASRSSAAGRLATDVTRVMQTLGMQGGALRVEVAPAEPTPHGVDRVDFLISAHAHATPQPIHRVASGGELSRIALAIAVSTSALGEAETLIFDEVDSGVGGAVAATVGQLLQHLGRTRQVLCVTHLPQVAACADHHLRVTKQVRAKQAASNVEVLSEDDRTNEIARMLGGEHVSATTLAHAAELLKQSNTQATGAGRSRTAA